MFNKLKIKFWDYILPRLSNNLDKYQKVKNSLNKNKIESRIQSCGFNLKLNGERHIIRDPKKLVIGNNVHIGDNFYLASEGGVIIGDNCHISRNVTVYSVNHNYLGSVLPYDQTTRYKSVSIGKNVWIGMNVSILPGVTIGDGAIIGMGAIVNRDVEKNEIVGNASLKHIKYRNESHYELLEKEKKYGGSNGKPLTDNELNSFLPSYYTNKENDVVFVLGTGRSGSTSIVDIFNQNPNCKAFHEDIRQLIRISTELAYYPERKNEYYNELESIFKTKIWQAYNNQLLIHSDQRLWNLIPFLSEYFPNAKFIHLIREPYSCIKSMVARGWYSENEYPELQTHDWAKYRLQGDQVNFFSKPEWQKLTQIQKCTWYWFFINNSIKKQLEQFKNTEFIEFKLENINTNLGELSIFIGQVDFNFQPLISNRVKSKDEYKLKKTQSEETNIEIDSFLQQLKSKNLKINL